MIFGASDEVAMWILQVSDIHLGDEARFAISTNEQLRLLLRQIDKYVPEDEEIVVAICGDLTSRGDRNGFGLAVQFFRSMQKGSSRSMRFLACPGNHDIVHGSRTFSDFNQAAYALTQDASLMFTPDHTASKVTIDNADFVLWNSAFHGDHTHGLIDLKQAADVLRTARSEQRIVLTHHNLIPAGQDDRSTTVNAYQAIQLAISGAAGAVMHGHIHAGSYITVGPRQTAIIGVGSLFFPPEGNFNNQFNLVELVHGSVQRAIRLRLVADFEAEGRVGDFQAQVLA